jgi:hypothetical protein
VKRTRFFLPAIAGVTLSSMACSSGALRTQDPGQLRPPQTTVSPEPVGPYELVMRVPATRRKEPPSAAALAAITARGRALAAYDSAAWRANNAVSALGPLARDVNRYIARKTSTGWDIVFGHMNATKDAFVIRYEARKEPGDGFYSAQQLPRPRADTGFYFRAARAIDLVLEDFRGELRPYNVATIPTEAGDWWVYFFPAQTDPGVFPLGADARYHVSADGRTILDKRSLHKVVIEYSGPGEDDSPDVQAGMHVAVLDDVPEDTDVYHVLSRSPSMPEYITTNAFVYRVETNGAIKYVGRRENMFRSAAGNGSGSY